MVRVKTGFDTHHTGRSEAVCQHVGPTASWTAVTLAIRSRLPASSTR